MHEGAEARVRLACAARLDLARRGVSSRSRCVGGFAKIVNGARRGFARRGNGMVGFGRQLIYRQSSICFAEEGRLRSP